MGIYRFCTSLFLMMCFSPRGERRQLGGHVRLQHVLNSVSCITLEITSSGHLFLVHSTLKNRSEAKKPSFLMMKTPAEPSFYYLSIDHYSLAMALLIQQ